MILKPLLYVFVTETVVGVILIQAVHKVAEFFEKSDAADRVYYPGLKSDPGYEVQKKQADGAGAMISFVLDEKYDYKKFFEGIKSVKELYNQGKVKRHPIVWELYRYLNNLDINKQYITKNYVVIDDGTIDLDSPEDINRLKID